MKKMKKAILIAQIVFELAVALAASGLAAVALFDALYRVFVAYAVMAVYMWAIVRIRIKGLKSADDGLGE